MEFREKTFLFLALIFVALGVIFIFQNLSTGKLRIIACDVGQGDATLVISPGGKQVLIDGGPGTKVVSCLSQKMPFWDREVEMVVSTHPDKDHLEGLLEVLARYKVDMAVTNGYGADTELYKEWEKALVKSGTKIHVAKAGEKVVVDKITLDVLWPEGGDRDVFGVKPDSNENSVVLRLSAGDFCGYLTGDITKEILENLVDRQCQVLKLSHHGSKTGTNERVLDLVNPKVAILEVGRNNYNLPNKDVMDLLNTKGVKILRTDEGKNVEIDSDGEGFEAKN